MSKVKATIFIVGVYLSSMVIMLYYVLTSPTIEQIQTALMK